MLGKEKLKELGEAGIIAGPDESEEAFVKRLYILKKTAPSQLLKGYTIHPWEGDFEKLLGARPDWIPLTYSNRKLLPWQGAVLWVFDHKIPLIQLRKGFKKGKFLLYSCEEVLLHETIHALRASFEEPKYEEILAYAHSKSKWRRFLGPLFRKPSHALFFISLIFICLLIQGSSLLFLDSPFLPYLQFLSLVPCVDLALRGATLVKDRRLLKKTLEKISQLFPKQANPFPVALRLKDSEIQKFATDSVEQVLTYIEEQVPRSVRWRQILAQFG
ncbi:hypothetical protein [Candidatus Neptunochlamydia vexilliferae]|uniref:hypothetical protein n=1 Tax=Candidatus Neptunichlamydia vexilliferae TaxID=1651774 RepID=UPI001890FF78|nr:hypothetical protein [Candidatus Neptunochlamydia vexilliferae]